MAISIVAQELISCQEAPNSVDTSSFQPGSKPTKSVQLTPTWSSSSFKSRSKSKTSWLNRHPSSPESVFHKDCWGPHRTISGVIFFPNFIHISTAKAAHFKVKTPKYLHAKDILGCAQNKFSKPSRDPWGLFHCTLFFGHSWESKITNKHISVKDFFTFFRLTYQVSAWVF